MKFPPSAEEIAKLRAEVPALTRCILCEAPAEWMSAFVPSEEWLARFGRALPPGGRWVRYYGVCTACIVGALMPLVEPIIREELDAF